MNDCRVILAADRQMILIELSDITDELEAYMEAELPREQFDFRSRYMRAQDIHWLEVLGMHIEGHLGRHRVILSGQTRQLTLAFSVAADVDPEEIRRRIMDFLSLPCYNLNVRHPQAVGS